METTTAQRNNYEYPCPPERCYTVKKVKPVAVVLAVLILIISIVAFTIACMGGIHLFTDKVK